MSINRKRGSIALARQLCYQINGAADDSDDISAGGGYGSVDIAEILSREVVRLREALAQEKEPVVLQYPQKDIDWQREQQIKAQASTPPQGIYYTPPQRTWVRLTDEDISEIVRGTHNTGSFVRAIEAKLKEKNT